MLVSVRARAPAGGAPTHALITTETPEGSSEEASRIRAEEQSDALSTGAHIALAGFEGFG